MEKLVDYSDYIMAAYTAGGAIIAILTLTILYKYFKLRSDIKKLSNEKPS